MTSVLRAALGTCVGLKPVSPESVPCRHSQDSQSTLMMHAPAPQSAHLGGLLADFVERGSGRSNTPRQGCPSAAARSSSRMTTYQPG